VERSSSSSRADVLEDGADGEDRSEIALLTRVERFAAGGAGALMTASGAYAVFATSNQAGAAALVIIGAALLLIGIQGTPLVRMTGGGNAVELERRKRRATVRRVRAIVETEDEPDRREALAEGAAAAEPALRPLADWVRYQNALHAQLLVLGDAQVELQTRDGRPDFLMTRGEATIAIEVKNVLDGAVSISASVARLRAFGSILPTLLVVNYKPTASAIEYAHSQGVEVVTWRDSRDNEALLAALNRLLQAPETRQAQERKPGPAQRSS
jgi:hypothetical protein